MKGEAVGYQVEITRVGMLTQALQFRNRRDADRRFESYVYEREADIRRGWQPDEVSVRMFRVYRSPDHLMVSVDRVKAIREVIGA